ncbi:MAG TPA: heme-binding domain-containing protein [Gemmatimonadales bacterium]|nr:heme-binding domain-containing protein [Gemmatimonadales bacterium]
MTGILRRARLRRLARAVGAALVIALVGAQFIRPEHPRGVLPSDGRMNDLVTVPNGVDSLLRRSCYDCHSDETRWPWYSHVAPVSWLVIHDVRHARGDLDFSRWSTDPVREPTPQQQFRWMCQDVRRDIMPPRLYLLMHADARLSEADKDLLCGWTAEQGG